MWSYKIADVNIASGQLVVSIDFYDDGGIFETFTEYIRTDKVLEEEWADQYCQRRIGELNDLSEYATRISHQDLVFKDVPTPLKPKGDPIDPGPMVME